MLFTHNKKVVECPWTAVSLLLAMLFVSVSHAAEIRYVSDQLTLKMYKDADLRQQWPVLKSGDRVRILKRENSYAKVELDNGRIGWVKSSYLEKAEPAAVQLARVQKELDELRSKHTDLLIEEPVSLQEPDAELLARVEAAEASQQNMKLRMKELESERMQHIEEKRALSMEVDARGSSRYILLWIILPILTLISGFFLGFKYLENKIKLRFGGHNPI